MTRPEAAQGKRDARAVLDGIYEPSASTSLERASGFVAAAIAGVAWYAGTAFLLEDLRQSAVLPASRVSTVELEDQDARRAPRR
jgi:hypothetical protein